METLQEAEGQVTRWSKSDLALATNRLGARVQSQNKFNARKKVVDGITFDSTHEAEVYQGLKLRQMAGQISDLKTHVPIRVVINSHYVFQLIVDFTYKVGPQEVFEDAKGYKKGAAYQLFRLKKAIIKAAMGIGVDEV